MIRRRINCFTCGRPLYIKRVRNVMQRSAKTWRSTLTLACGHQRAYDSRTDPRAWRGDSCEEAN